MPRFGEFRGIPHSIDYCLIKPDQAVDYYEAWRNNGLSFQRLLYATDPDTLFAYVLNDIPAKGAAILIKDAMRFTDNYEITKPNIKIFSRRPRGATAQAEGAFFNRITVKPPATLNDSIDLILRRLWLKELVLDAADYPVVGVDFRNCVFKTDTPYNHCIRFEGDNYITRIVSEDCNIWDYTTGIADKGAIYCNNIAVGNGQIHFNRLSYQAMYSNQCLLRFKTGSRMGNMYFHEIPVAYYIAGQTGCSLVHQEANSKMGYIRFDKGLIEAHQNFTVVEIENGSTDQMTCGLDFFNMGLYGDGGLTKTLINNLADNLDWDAAVYNTVMFKECWKQDNVGTFNIGTTGAGARFTWVLLNWRGHQPV